MPNWEAYSEAYKRGILPEDKRAVFEEAMKRGLVPNTTPAESAPQPSPVQAQPETPPKGLNQLLGEGSMLEYQGAMTEPSRPIAGAVAPYAPVVGAVVGGMAAAPANVVAPGAAEVAGIGLGYMAGQQAETLLKKYSQGAPLPSGAEMGMQAVEDYPNAAAGALGGPVLGKFLEGGLGLAAKGFDSLSRRMYEGVLKIPPRSVPKWLRDKAVKAGLEGKYTPTEGGLTSLQTDIDLTNKEIAATIAKDPDKQIETRLILNRLDELKAKYADLPEKGKLIVEQIEKAKQNFIDSNGDVLSGKASQAMKTAIHRYYRPRYGKSQPNWTQEEFQIAEATAKGLRQGLMEQYPILRGLNEKDSALLELEKQLTGAVNRTRNWDIVGLTDLLGGGLGATADLFAESDSSPWKGAITGMALTRALRSPHVMSRLSFALSKAARAIKGPSGAPGWIGGEMETMGREPLALPAPAVQMGMQKQLGRGPMSLDEMYPQGQLPQGQQRLALPAPSQVQLYGPDTSFVPPVRPVEPNIASPLMRDQMGPLKAPRPTTGSSWLPYTKPAYEPPQIPKVVEPYSYGKDNWKITQLKEGGTDKSNKWKMEISDDYKNGLRGLIRDVGVGEPGRRIQLKDPTGPGEEWIAQNSSYPEFMKNQGWTRNEVMSALEKATKGEPLGQRQIQIVEKAVDHFDTMYYNDFKGGLIHEGIPQAAISSTETEANSVFAKEMAKDFSDVIRQIREGKIDPEAQLRFTTFLDEIGLTLDDLLKIKPSIPSSGGLK